jgi:hypothetical protein
VHHTDGSGTVTLCRRALKGSPSPSSPGDWERVLKVLKEAGLVEENMTRLGKRATREPVTKKKVPSANYDTPEERAEISDLEDEDGEVGAKTPIRPAKTSKTGTSASSQAKSQSSRTPGTGRSRRIRPRLAREMIKVMGKEKYDAMCLELKEQSGASDGPSPHAVSFQTEGGGEAKGGKSASKKLDAQAVARRRERLAKQDTASSDSEASSRQSASDGAEFPTSRLFTDETAVVLKPAHTVLDDFMRSDTLAKHGRMNMRERDSLQFMSRYVQHCLGGVVDSLGRKIETLGVTLEQKVAKIDDKVDGIDDKVADFSTKVAGFQAVVDANQEVLAANKATLQSNDTLAKAVQGLLAAQNPPPVVRNREMYGLPPFDDSREGRGQQYYSQGHAASLHAGSPMPARAPYAGPSSDRAPYDGPSPYYPGTDAGSPYLPPYSGMPWNAPNYAPSYQNWTPIGGIIGRAGTEPRANSQPVHQPAIWLAQGPEKPPQEPPAEDAAPFEAAFAALAAKAAVGTQGPPPPAKAKQAVDAAMPGSETSMDLADAADAGLAQLTLGQIALNETNPVPKGPASDTSQDPDEEEDPPLRTPRKLPANSSQTLSGDESSGKLGAEARKKTPKKLKTVTPDGPAGAAVARHQKGDGGKTTGASATSAGASTAVVTPV